MTGQRRLFPEPKLAAYARKDQVCAGGTYAGLPLAVLRRRDISPAAKLVYAALLDHLRGAGTWVYPSLARLAEMTGTSRRGVQSALAALEAAGLIERRAKRGCGTAYAFAPLAPDGAGGQEDAQAATVGPCGPIDASAAPTDAEAGGAATGEIPARRPARAGRGRGEAVGKPVGNAPEGAQKLRQGGAESARGGCRICAGTGADSAPVNTAQNHGEETRAQRGPPARPPAAMDVASAWEDLLGLDRRWRSERREFEDFEQLLAAAVDLAEGRLGEPGAGWRTLSTVAHQVGRRDPPANSPVGMFLAEVRTLRLRQMRRRQQEGSKR